MPISPSLISFVPCKLTSSLRRSDPSFGLQNIAVFNTILKYYYVALLISSVFLFTHSVVVTDGSFDD